MPPPLDVDHDMVRAHAVTHGLASAAASFGIPYPTVRQWSKRESWFAKPVTADPHAHLPVTLKPTPVTCVTATQAAVSALQRHGEHSRLNIARAVRKGSIAAARMEGAELLERAGQLRSLAATGDLIHGWTADRETGDKPLFRLDLRVSADGGPAMVIDGACQVEPIEGREA